MNEQLIVKNFGPIKDATVDFKRVTVFIGPTGGGKSTLAKLAAIFRDDDWLRETKHLDRYTKFNRKLQKFQIFSYLKKEGQVEWDSEDDSLFFNQGGFHHSSTERKKNVMKGINILEKLAYEMKSTFLDELIHNASADEGKIIADIQGTKNDVYYIPADRAFAAAIEASLAGLVLNNVALPATLLGFINEFKQAQMSVSYQPLEVPFLNITYREINRKTVIDINEEEPVELAESASGIQAVVPMLLVIARSSGQWIKEFESKSFIIEEPELNLYPTAQQGLLNWLVEKCTKGENDLTITTHSPYILSHLNLLLYAHHVGTKDEEKRRKVAAIIPEQYWLNPDEFAAYYVNGPEGAGGVRSLLDPETKLISQNELDAVSGVQADEFDQLLDINRGF